MSEADLEARNWGFYIQDVICFGGKVPAYTEGLDQEAFVVEDHICDATLHNIELIGEAATRIPVEAREAHLEIQLRQIVGARNRVAHA
ncbi:MAG: DUF86 domain-containing protein [Caldilineaceae bacterium]|nr:DUF86 domain-containing protein [Caldilineaceae bacterium]